MMQPRQRFPWLALLLGLLIGVGGGLSYAWLLNPVNLVNVAPSQLLPEDQRTYILLISEAYMHDQRTDWAQGRLQQLGLSDAAGAVAAQADEAYYSAADPREIRALTELAEALGAHPAAAEVFSGTEQPTAVADSGTPTATFESMPTITPTPDAPTATPTRVRPTATSTPDRVLETNFDLVDWQPNICDVERTEGQIEIYVTNAEGEGIPGLEIQVTWEGQTDRFFTGLKPDIDPGYADFKMEPNKRYTVALVGLAEDVVGIDSTPCADTGLPPTYEMYFAPGATDEPTIESP